MHKKRKTILLLFFLQFSVCVLQMEGREKEDFVKIANRTMASDNVVTDSLSLWHGAAFSAVTSRGGVLPNAFVDYKKGKWQFHGNLSMDIGKSHNDENTNKLFKAGDADNCYSVEEDDHSSENVNLEFLYMPSKNDILRFSFFEVYNYDNTQSNTMDDDIDVHGTPTSRQYEDKDMVSRQFNCGVLAEYKHLYTKGGSILARAYYKYDSNPTDVDYNIWSTVNDITLMSEHQHYHSSDPKCGVIYLSPQWGGFSFGIREKVALLRTKVDNGTSYVNFNTTNSFSSAEVNFKTGKTALMAFGSFEYYGQHLELLGDLSSTGSSQVNNKRYFDDWQLGGSVTQGIGAHHELKLSYEALITRPTYLQLYPLFIVGTSGLSVPRKGNPDLNPSHQSNLALTYTVKYPIWKLSTQIAYCKSTDEISKVSKYEPDGSTYFSWLNDAEQDILKLELNGEVKSKNFDMTCGFHARHINYVGEHVRNDKSWSFSFKACPEWKLPNKWTLYLVGIYSGKEKHQYYDTNDYLYTACGAQKVIGRWVVYAMLQDITESEEQKTYYYEKNTTQIADKYHSRAVILGASYQF